MENKVKISNTVNFVLQGKGGVGKSLIATMLDQWFLKVGAPV
ncbi:hypothetical protein [Caballeronia grimmiae]|nr:hypothetical protein [Caballeronia grimmiae]